jgi:hypothetical protein
MGGKEPWYDKHAKEAAGGIRRSDRRQEKARKEQREGSRKQRRAEHVGRLMSGAQNREPVATLEILGKEVRAPD